MFFFLRDGHRTGDSIRSFLPGRGGDTVAACAERAFDPMAGFMRGTSLIALIDARFITLGLAAIRLPRTVGRCEDANATEVAIMIRGRG
ncbi:hypothetical protein PUR71_24890 [Streptomyces sp. SP17BM10]|nr:hypothetical protein [Streptomyces sp. SP17BM10]